MQLVTVKIDKPAGTNFVLGQTHFIKSVEDRGVENEGEIRCRKDFLRQIGYKL